MPIVSSGERAHGRGRLLLVVAALAAVAFGLWGALRRGPAPAVVITGDHVAIGAETRITAHFSEPSSGLGTVTLELVQGDRSVVLAQQRFARAGAFSPWRGRLTAAADLTATVGRSAQAWLQEGEATVRATADRVAGPLRSHAPVVVEKKMAVLLRPPRLELLSRQHYVRQGGSGVVVFRVGDGVVRSGVRAGDTVSLSFPLPGGGPGERFALFAVPWELDDVNQVRLFAEDGAGNRTELPFVDLFKKAPPKTDTIELSDAFLQRVVPEIASRTPGFDASGSLLDQYLRINGEERRAVLAKIATIAKDTQRAFLWRGAFLQLPDSQRRAGFAETRAYVYQGKVVDHQTHLGLDLASTEHAPIPAANSGRVVFTGWLVIYGNAVIIDHGYGLMSLYGHMSEISVKPGDVVAKGQIIGHTGSTGLAGGDHLHLEIFVQGKSVDPLEWLDEHWIRDNIGNKVKLP